MSAEVEIIDLEPKPTLTSRGRTKADSIPVDLIYDDSDDDDQTLQHAILASLRSTATSSPPPPPIIDLTHDHEEHTFHSSSTTSKRGKKKVSSVSKFETGQSSSNSNPRKSSKLKPFVCQICFEPKPLTESFTAEGCIHVYCKECMSSHVAAKLQDNVTNITCPSIGCNGTLEPYYCREILPLDVFERWGNALCESLISTTEKFYCPFKDCSALLINDGTNGITESECPHCHRLFCAQCKSVWHCGMECSEYRKLDKGENEREDIMLMNLAKNKKWKRCPKCKIFVEKSEGCMFIKCRCKFTFCYNCGTAYNTLNHLCPKCNH